MAAESMRFYVNAKKANWWRNSLHSPVKWECDQSFQQWCTGAEREVRSRQTFYELAAVFRNYPFRWMFSASLNKSNGMCPCCTTGAKSNSSLHQVYVWMGATKHRQMSKELQCECIDVIKVIVGMRHSVRTTDRAIGGKCGNYAMCWTLSTTTSIECDSLSTKTFNSSSNLREFSQRFRTDSQK